MARKRPPPQAQNPLPRLRDLRGEPDSGSSAGSPSGSPARSSANDHRGAAPGAPTDAWVTTRQVRRRDPATNRWRKRRVAIVRWRRPDGRIAEKSFDDPLEAEKYLQERNATRRVDLGDPAAGGRAGTGAARVLLSAWTDRYLEARFPDYVRLKRGEIDKLDGRSYVGLVKSSVDRFIDVVGDHALADYRASDFDAFKNALGRQTFTRRCNASGKTKGEVRTYKLRPATVEGYVAKLRTVFRAAEAEGLITRRVPIRVRQIAYEKAVLEKEDVEKILTFAETWPPESNRGTGTGPGRMHPVLLALYYTMVRQGELIHLTWQDLRREGRTIVEILVQPKEWREGGETRRWEPKDREVRAIPVHPRLAAELARLARKKTHRKWIFTNGKDERWTASSLASLMKRFSGACGYDLGFHIWRRTGLTHLHDAGAPIKDIQAIAGHSQISTTMKYIRSSAKGQRKTILKLD